MQKLFEQEVINSFGDTGFLTKMVANSIGQTYTDDNIEDHWQTWQTAFVAGWDTGIAANNLIGSKR
jgi:hypothetical protein